MSVEILGGEGRKNKLTIIILIRKKDFIQRLFGLPELARGYQLYKVGRDQSSFRWPRKLIADTIWPGFHSCCHRALPTITTGHCHKHRTRDLVCLCLVSLGPQPSARVEYSIVQPSMVCSTKTLFNKKPQKRGR